MKTIRPGPEKATEREVTLRDFAEYFPYAPAALCIKECVRLRRTRELSCPPPILDVGCGDGLFARLAFPEVEIWGIDVDGNEGRRAQASRAYSHVLLADVTRATLPEGFFGSCVANCSLEHIPGIDGALRTVRRSLKPGAPVYAFVPNRDWARHLLSARLLSRIGLASAADAICDGIDSIFKHHHLEDAEGWARVFRDAGLHVVDVEPIGSTASTVAFEAFLLPSLLGLANKRLTGRWTLLPALRKLVAAPVYGLVKEAFDVFGGAERTAEFLVVARRED